MVYGRRVEDTLLSFEASGGLLEASLVMRDRETDSWWSIMSSQSIGGKLKGTALHKLPLGEKTTWSEWKKRHPSTKILSVDGREHEVNNPYASYFSSEGTFRDIEVSDKRLPAKEPIFAFEDSGTAYAAPHSALMGGKALPLESGGWVVLIRHSEDELLHSTRAYRWLGEEPLKAGVDLPRLVSRGSEWIEPLTGFDTFWYSWVLVQKDSRILR